MSNVIVLKGKGHFIEADADEALSPGQCVEIAADGDVDQCQSAVAAALKGGLMIAVENALEGKTVDDAYAIGDQVLIYIPLPGDEVQVLIASGEDIDVGDSIVVIGTGDGNFEEAAGTEVKFQLEAIEGPGALAADTLVACRVL